MKDDMEKPTYNIKYPALGICGISCRLCTRYHTQGKSRCEGCKSEAKMREWCPFITCSMKKRGIEFCWDCPDGDTCKRWEKRRIFAQEHDSYVCYQRFEDNISIAREHSVNKLEDKLKAREKILIEMLDDFNEGRSKSYYCVAATVLEFDELKSALTKARKQSKSLEIKDKAKLMRSVLDEIAANNGYYLKLRGFK